MIIIGIDPGTATTGYGVIKKTKSQLMCLAYGSITTPAKQANNLRLQKIYKETLGLIKKHKPDIIAIEKLFFFKNLKTVMPVAESRGVILLACCESKAQIKELTPLQIKMGICGYGRAEKKQIQKMVKEILKLKEIPKPDDASDALAAAICCSFNLSKAK